MSRTEKIVTHEAACLEAGNHDGFKFWRGLRNQAEAPSCGSSAS